MDSAKAERTLAQIFTWKDRFLTYTDMVCSSVPEDVDAFRPTDPKGGFVFSPLEQAAHIADTRWMFVEWMTGEDCKDRHFMREYGGTEKPWQFREITKDAVISSLKESREKVEEILLWPESKLAESTESLVKTHEAHRKQLQEAGKDTSELDAAGPNVVANVVMFTMAHEQAHRAVLQHMLRMNNVDVPRLA